MTSGRHAPHALAGLLALALMAPVACSRPEREDRWPSRNFSGTYVARARTTTSDCPAAVFARSDTLLVAVTQGHDNRAQVEIFPVVSMSGAFTGDRLEARAAVLNTALAAATAGPGGDGARPAADSLRYAVDLRFEGNGFEGQYTVRQPPLGAGLGACSQTFALKGTLREERP